MSPFGEHCRKWWPASWFQATTRANFALGQDIFPLGRLEEILTDIAGNGGLPRGTSLFRAATQANFALGDIFDVALWPRGQLWRTHVP